MSIRPEVAGPNLTLFRGGPSPINTSYVETWLQSSMPTTITTLKQLHVDEYASWPGRLSLCCSWVNWVSVVPGHSHIERVRETFNLSSGSWPRGVRTADTVIPRSIYLLQKIPVFKRPIGLFTDISGYPSFVIHAWPIESRGRRKCFKETLGKSASKQNTISTQNADISISSGSVATIDKSAKR